ncbi:hypothetical protein PG5_10390 [Pseudomonas sp. G5(2012)]|nr:hypothetical protein PG5_10390 [Pseudomonas sp. G5(2012)]
MVQRCIASRLAPTKSINQQAKKKPLPRRSSGFLEVPR